MEYLILMTMAGSVLTLAYWVWDKFFHDFLTQSMKYRALTVTLLVYAIPWVWLKGIYGYAVQYFAPVREPVIAGLHIIDIADIVTEEEAYITPNYWLRLLAMGIWLAVALVLLARKVKSYLNNRWLLLDTADICEDKDVMEMAERLRDELHFRGKVRIYITPDVNTTLTLGAFKPLIFLQREYTEEQLYFILKHEMIHILRKDMLRKLILEFICCFHWFNYLVHGLNGLFGEICEKSCDERVRRDATKEEAEVYVQLLADNYRRLKESYSDTIPWQNIPFGSGLDNTFEIMSERVNLVMEGKVVKSWKKRLVGSVFAGALVVNSFTAMAYPDVYHVESDSTEVAQEMSDGSAFWADGFTEIEADGYGDPVIEVHYDNEFIDEDGNVYPVDASSPYVFCIKHNIVSGYVQTHVKDDNGGCTVKVYESTKCTICNTIWVGDKIKTTIWEKCPH